MNQRMPSRPSVLLFDVNETLLNLQPLEEGIDAVLLENGASRLWFTTMLQYSLVMTVSGQYQALGEIGAATLQMMAKNREVVLGADEAKEALKPMLSLPAHADVRGALERFKAAGFRMATLTNSSTAACRAQLDNAGIADLFERQLSVETPGKFKPHRDVYQWAASEMGVPVGECMLVAAHAWDVAGAAWAGMQTAFIERAGNQVFPLAHAPTFSASDLDGLFEQLAGK